MSTQRMDHLDSSIANPSDSESPASHNAAVGDTNDAARTSEAQVAYAADDQTGMPSSIDLGIDIGSTTTKYVVLDTSTGARLASGYKRHNARQAESVAHVLDEVRAAFPATAIRAAVTG